MTTLDIIRFQCDRVQSGGEQPDFPIGCRCQTVGATWTEWVVRKIVRYPSANEPYAQLQRVERPHDCKSIALDALLDRRLYRLTDGDGWEAPEASGRAALAQRINRLISGRR